MQMLYCTKVYEDHNVLYSFLIGWLVGWLGGSVVERRSLTGELSLVCTGPAADG